MNHRSQYNSNNYSQPPSLPPGIIITVISLMAFIIGLLVMHVIRESLDRAPKNQTEGVERKSDDLQLRNQTEGVERKSDDLQLRNQTEGVERKSDNLQLRNQTEGVARKSDDLQPKD